MSLPILYSFKRCPYAMRARMAIFLANIKCELREVKLSNKPQSMINASKKGTVPVLILKNKVLDESLDIINWVIKENKIFDESLKSCHHELSENLILQFDKDFKFHLDRYKYSTRYEAKEKFTHREACLSILKQIENAHSKKIYFFGDKINKIDICLLPFIRQFRIADPKWFDSLNEIPNVQNWLNSFLDSELLKHIMVKYEFWKQEDDLKYFPINQ